MADNQIKISVNLDSKEFDNNFKRIMNQINELRRATSGVPGFGATSSNTPSKVGSGANQNINASQSDKSLQGLQKTLEGITGRADTFNKSLSALSKTLDDLSNKAQSAATAQQQITTQQTVAGARVKPEGVDRLLTALQKGGVGGLTTALGRIGPGGVLNAVGPYLGAAVSGIGPAMTAYGSFQGFKAGLPGREAERDVEIGRGAGQLRERALRGESFEDIAFAPERAKAVQRSMDFFKQAQDAREYRATGKGLVSAAGIAGGAYAGAKIGAGIGSFVPVVGTAIGAGVGALAGGGLAYAMGKGTGITDEEAYYGLTRNKEALQKMTAKEAMQEQEKYNLQEMMRDPYKYSQTKFLGENREMLSRIQKSTGLSDVGMYGEGGFVQRGANQFSFAERGGMQQQIVGAGGAVSGQSNAHLMALQAQRNLGLTNSGQAMGRLTSYLNPNESEEAFVKVLAKGFSVGLDDSDYREESKDYLAQVTAIASRMGGGQEMVAERIAAGMGDDISRRSVGKSAEAFQSLTQYQEETGGVIGSTKFRLMNEDPLLKRLEGTSRLGAQKLKRSDIEQGAENPVMRQYLQEIQESMRKEGKNEEEISKFGMGELKKSLIGVHEKSTFGGFAQGDKIEKLIEQAKNEKDPVKKQKLADQASAMAFGMEFGGSAEEAGRMIKQRIGIEEKVTPGVVQEKLEAPPTEGTEKIKQAGAQRQAEQMKDMQKNFENIFANAMTNAGQSLANQLVMEEFNKKLADGGEKAVQAFLEAYKNLPEKLKTGQQPPAPKREVKGQ